MKPTTKTRVQRRVEKKQALMLVALVTLITVVSFVLGVVVGRHSEGPAAVLQVGESQRIIVDDRVETPVVPAADVAQPADEKLSFYDNLSKKELAPLGSGINLPPEVAPQKVAAELVVTEPAAQPEEAQLPKASPPVPIPEPLSAPQSDSLPAVVKGGGWVVQVFSSRSAADAGMLRDKLGGKGYPAFITEADLGEKGVWYRVIFGPYADKNAAIQAQAYAGTKDDLVGFVKRR